MLDNHEIKQIATFIGLNDAEIDGRLLRYSQPSDRMRSLLGRLMAFQHYTLDCKQLSFDRDKNDRPVICINSSISDKFSISHHGDWVVFAAGDDSNVEHIGVDVVRVNEIPTDESWPEFLQGMRHAFTEAEYRAITSTIDHSVQMKRFYKAWALKESYLKALGVGLSFEPSCMDFGNMLREEQYTFTINDNWQFELRELDSVYVIAVAIKYKHNPVTLQLQEFETDQLMKGIRDKIN